MLPSRLTTRDTDDRFTREGLRRLVTGAGLVLLVGVGLAGEYVAQEVFAGRALPPSTAVDGDHTTRPVADEQVPPEAPEAVSGFVAEVGERLLDAAGDPSDTLRSVVGWFTGQSEATAAGDTQGDAI